MALAPKRFYVDVTLGADDARTGRFHILLDAKPVKTPRGHVLTLAGRALAEAVAAEWRAQGEKLDPSSMPMTRLAASALDHIAPRIEAVRQEVLSYAATDLLCHRAATPERLVAEQQRVWQPYLDWAADTLGARLEVRAGLVAIEQPPEAIAAFARALAAFGAEHVFVVHALTHQFGSLVLALAVLHRHVPAHEALEASRLDETFQAEIWGRDEEAEARRARIAREVADLARFLSLLG
jgi:chaperone required for assembly of F1-ATPase